MSETMQAVMGALPCLAVLLAVLVAVVLFLSLPKARARADEDHAEIFADYLRRKRLGELQEAQAPHEAAK